MSDRHFDELATRFAEKIYGGAKGAIRLAVLQADLKEALPERPLRVLDVGAGTDHPMEEDESPMTGAEGGDLVSYGDGVAVYSDGTQTDGTTWTRSPVLPGMEYDGQTLLEDQAPYKGANGGDLVDFDGSRGVAVYSDGTETDGKEWRKVGEQTTPVVSSAWSRIIAAGSAR